MPKAKREKTPAQNRTLNWLLQEAGLFDEAARDYLEARCGKRRRRDMDFYDFKKVIDDLSYKTGLKPGETAPRPGTQKIEQPRTKAPHKKTDPITPDQMDYIGGLYVKIGADGAAQIAMNKRTIKKSWPQTVGDGQKIIEMLKDMIERGYESDGDKTQNEK
jgi:hypothetical protein